MKKIFPFLIILVFMVSCSLSDSLSALLDRIIAEKPAPVESNDIMTLIANDSISVISIRGNTIASTISGRTVDVELVNNTDQALEVIIPCGLIYIPTDEDASRMIGVQSHRITFDAGETKTIKPFVLSIDNLKALPTADKTYRLELLTEGKQLEFANCLCMKDLPAEIETEDLISIQLAMWMIDESSIITSLPDQLNDWLQHTTGLPIDIPGLDSTLQNLLGDLAPEAQAWLDRCGIKLKN